MKDSNFSFLLRGTKPSKSNEGTSMVLFVSNKWIYFCLQSTSEIDHSASSILEFGIWYTPVFKVPLNGLVKV